MLDGGAYRVQLEAVLNPQSWVPPLTATYQHRSPARFSGSIREGMIAAEQRSDSEGGITLIGAERRTWRTVTHVRRLPVEEGQMMLGELLARRLLQSTHASRTRPKPPRCRSSLLSINRRRLSSATLALVCDAVDRERPTRRLHHRQCAGRRVARADHWAVRCWQVAHHPLARCAVAAFGQARKLPHHSHSESASFRTVVELILAPLADDPRYAQARENLTRAVAEVNIKDAVVIFRGHLENALRAERERLIGELREHPERTNLKALIGHAGMLPRLFSDAALDQHFIEHVLSRVVSRALSGRSEGAEDDETLSQFTADDLILPSTVALNQAARPVHDYYQRNIAPLDAERLQPVVDLLNEAVDPAIGNVFQLEQSTGGMTLQDIILAVREILLPTARTLCCSSRISRRLLAFRRCCSKVCIQEGEREGKKVRATMRTALALTDGISPFATPYSPVPSANG